MDKAKRLGQMVQFMKASISRVRSMAMECTVGMMAQGIKATGLKTRSKAWALTHG